MRPSELLLLCSSDFLTFLPYEAHAMTMCIINTSNDVDLFETISNTYFKISSFTKLISKRCLRYTSLSYKGFCEIIND